MVQMTEFRVVMPLSVEEYRIAQVYMITKMQQQQTHDSEGVEVLVNKPFEDEEFGKGQYTSKVYHLQSKAPAWLTALAPADALLVEEEAWNAYPKCKAVLKCPYFTKFKITVETVHLADNGQSANVHKLPSSALQTRKVQMIDIASNEKDYWSYVIAGDAIDLRTFKSEKTGRGLLQSGWQETCKPVMTAYKLVTVDAPYWGFGTRLEQLVLGGERALFTESHKRCFAWIDEWFGLTFEDVRKLELRTDEILRKSIADHGVAQGKLTSLESENKVNGVVEAGQSSAEQSSHLDERKAEEDPQKGVSQGKLRSVTTVGGTSAGWLW
jgi:hypothetical protein